MNSHDAAAFISTLIQGLAVQAKGGATRRPLRQLVTSVLASWPVEAKGTGKRRTYRNVDEAPEVA